MSSPPSTSSKSSTFVLEPLLPLEPLPDGTTPQLPQLPRPDPTSQPNSPSSGSSGNGKGGGSSVSIGAIVGACVGAVLLISALLYLYRRYRVRARQTKNKMRAAETSIGDPLSSTISRSNNTIAGDAYMMDAVKINMSPSNNSNNSGGGSRSIKTASGGSSGIESLSHLRPNGSADSPQFDHYGSTSFTHEKPAMVVTSMPTKSNTNDSTGEPVSPAPSHTGTVISPKSSATPTPTPPPPPVSGTAASGVAQLPSPPPTASPEPAMILQPLPQPPLHQQPSQPTQPAATDASAAMPYLQQYIDTSEPAVSTNGMPVSTIPSENQYILPPVPTFSQNIGDIRTIYLMPAESMDAASAPTPASLAQPQPSYQLQPEQPVQQEQTVINMVPMSDR